MDGYAPGQSLAISGKARYNRYISSMVGLTIFITPWNILNMLFSLLASEFSSQPAG